MEIHTPPRTFTRLLAFGFSGIPPLLSGIPTKTSPWNPEPPVTGLLWHSQRFRSCTSNNLSLALGLLFAVLNT